MTTFSESFVSTCSGYVFYGPPELLILLSLFFYITSFSQWPAMMSSRQQRWAADGHHEQPMTTMSSQWPPWAYRLWSCGGWRHQHRQWLKIYNIHVLRHSGSITYYFTYYFRCLFFNYFTWISNKKELLYLDFWRFTLLLASFFTFLLTENANLRNLLNLQFTYENRLSFTYYLEKVIFVSYDITYTYTYKTRESSYFHLK